MGVQDILQDIPIQDISKFEVEQSVGVQDIGVQDIVLIQDIQDIDQNGVAALLENDAYL